MPSFKIKTAVAMQKLGAKIAAVCGNGIMIYLNGELGAGKTTFVRGFLAGLGYEGYVRSPTFTLVEPYTVGTIKIYHLDLYRLANAEELEYIGIRDYCNTDSICLVEWPKRGAGFLQPADLVCDFEFVEKGRKVDVVATSANGILIIGKLKGNVSKKIS